MPTTGTGNEQEQSVLGFVEEELPHCDVSREALVYMQKQQADWLKSSKGILERHRVQPRVAKTVCVYGVPAVQLFVRAPLPLLCRQQLPCTVLQCSLCVCATG